MFDTLTVGTTFASTDSGSMPGPIMLLRRLLILYAVLAALALVWDLVESKVDHRRKSHRWKRCKWKPPVCRKKHGLPIARGPFSTTMTILGSVGQTEKKLLLLLSQHHAFPAVIGEYITRTLWEHSLVDVCAKVQGFGLKRARPHSGIRSQRVTYAMVGSRNDP